MLSFEVNKDVYIDYTVCVLHHHHHFFDHALVCKKITTTRNWVLWFSWSFSL